MPQISKNILFCLIFVWFALPTNAQTKQKIVITSSVDQSNQPCYFILPRDYDKDKSQRYPVLMALHTWSSSVEQTTLIGKPKHTNKDGFTYSLTFGGQTTVHKPVEVKLLSRTFSMRWLMQNQLFALITNEFIWREFPVVVT